MDCFKNDYECLEKINNPPKKTKKPFNKVFETHKMPNGETHTGKTHTKSSKLVKCPKGHKICRCKKKPKCKKIKTSVKITSY
tara:strand:+ start:3475 stop:3720 length:246 start_codon:yes stop_codon:yes gene_type:complete